MPITACRPSAFLLGFPRSAAGWLGIALLALVSCDAERPNASSASASPAVAPITGESVLEDFDDARRWSIDSAANYAELTGTADHITQGGGALAVAYADNGRGKTILRKEVDDDLSRSRTMRLDVFNGSASRPACALAFRTVSGALFECMARPLEPGWNRDLVFVLDGKGLIDKSDLAKWSAERDRINRLMVHIIPDGGKSGMLTIDNLRVSGDGAVRRGEPPVVLEVHRPEQTIALGATAEIRLALRYRIAPVNAKDKSAAPYFERMTAVSARCVAPDGSAREVRGFCTGITPGADGLTYAYAIRLVLDRAGEWRYQVLVPALAGSASVGETAALRCVAQDPAPAMVTIDRADRRFFSATDGVWYYPLGENVAWAGDYEPYLKAISAAGGNYLRTWICPWNNPLDGAGKSHEVDFGSALGIDHLFDLAERYRVRVQLVLHYHGMLDGDWSRSPWNQANGGPCADPREFWTNGAAREQFKHYLDYVVARWSHSPSLFAWELFNETDLCPRFADRDIVEWHREMSAHLAAIDPNHHPVTTSATNCEVLSGLWHLPDLAFIQPHAYTSDIAGALDHVAAAFSAEPKPVFLGETGRGTEPRDDLSDGEGRLLHHALWLSWMRDLAGTPMPWWWDTHIEPNRLLKHLAGFAAFVKGEDRRGMHARRARTTIAPSLVVEAMVAPEVGYVYAYDPALISDPALQPVGSLWPPGRTLELSGLVSGTWFIEYWDTYAGTVAAHEERDCGADGILLLSPPAILARDFAIKLKRRGGGLPRLQLR